MPVASPPDVAWWGPGAPPTERWPGVTIDVTDEGGRYAFDSVKADRVCSWFPRFCSHSKGEQFAGKPFDLLDYQTALILRPLFGWVRPDGTRRFRKAFIEIPKKNGKTQLIAGLALYMLLADGEPGAEVYVAASDRDQARILFDAAKSMVEANPALKKRVICYRNHIAKADDPAAFFKVLSAEAATKHGPNIHCLIIDELHAQPDRELFETLTRGVIARTQPLILLITTAGDDDESICYEEYDYAKRVLSGTIQDDQHLPVIFEAKPDDAWQSEDLWRRVNPSYGITVQPIAIAQEAIQAGHEPKKLNDFLRYHLNRWVNSASAWIPVDWWDACEPTPIPNYAAWLDAQTPELSLLPCAAGLDLAQKIDLACFSVVFRQRIASAEAMNVEVVDEADGRVVKKMVSLNYRITVVPFFWIPEDTMREHEKTDGVPYSHWKQSGLITVTEGANIDYTVIYRDITEKILPRFPKLKQGFIGYDPAFATDIANELKNRAGLKVEEILQNYKYMSEACYIAEALIKAKHVSHGGHRVLRNHWENVSVKNDDARRIRPVKPRKASKHIDGVVASLMAIKSLAKVSDYKNPVRMFFMGGQPS